MKFSQNEKRRKKSPLTFIFLFLLVLTPFALSQVVQTQVIDLSEKARDYFIEATKGNIVGQETGSIFAQNDVVGTAEEDIQSQGGTLIFLQTAEFISIISSDTVNDILGGANANSVLIQGLDENFSEISEIVNLSATSTNTTQEYIRINKLLVKDVGTYSVSNAGIITATASLSLTTQVEIPIGEGISKSSHYTVPAGKRFIGTRIFVSVDTGKEVDVALKIRENADDVVSPFSPVIVPRFVKGISLPINAEQKSGLILNEKSDIWATGVTSVGTSEIEVNLDFVQYAIGT
ncbi:hypothetical protein LCGC14_0545820 [marine sediment metagenome]|uniref:Uncharacterized protein n=1 Tax=marine sediment metagenome TaxID=412755 RepID=A0A0F9S9S1_9ZZZZ